MKNLLVQCLYRSLLRLFPRNFYDEFADEMQSIFCEVVAEAASRGGAAQALVVCRELALLQLEALRLHLIPRLQRVIASGARPLGWEGPPTWKETLLVMAAFSLPLLGLYHRETGFLSTRFVTYLAVGLALGVFLAGFLKGFPRWSLPYLGLILAIAGFLLVGDSRVDQFAPQIFNRLGIDAQDESMQLLLEAAWSGFLWFSLFSLIALGVGTLALFKRCRVMLQRIRQDWTLASYILYSGILPMLGLSFARCVSQVTYAIASIFCLGIGAWLFLTSRQAAQRMLALFGGLTLAVSVAAAGEWPLHPPQAWESGLRVMTVSGIESTFATLEWAWMSALIVAPVLLLFLASQCRQRTASP